MMTDASTATRVKATRVRQTERIIKDVGESGVTNPSSSSGSGQHKRVRFSDQEHLDSKPEGDTEMQTGGQEAPVTRKRSAETDAERLEEEAAETAEADSDKRIAWKRKAEGDPSDMEVEDFVMNSLTELWQGKMISTVKLVCSSFSSVIAMLQACTRLAVTSQCVKSPRHLPVR